MNLATMDVESHIVATSMFKNGYAMVLREIPVTASGEVQLRSIPAASLGTLWFAGTKGVEIESIRTLEQTTTSTAPVGSLSEIMASNVGKQVQMAVSFDDHIAGRIVTGKILSASGDIVVLAQPDKSVITLPKSSISSISSASGDLIYEVPAVSTRKTLAFHVKGKGAISMICLEKGIAWAPGYSINLVSKEKLSLVAKATVLNDDENLDHVRAKFVTGFPNIPFAAFQDPLTSGESIDQYLGLLGQPVARSMAKQPSFRGGFGGGGFAAQAAAPAPEFDRPAEGMVFDGGSGQQLEDLFFYEQPDLTLDRGQRGYYVLFQMDAPYKDIYTCEVPDAVQDSNPEVWHALAFKNTSGKPFTTGPGITFKNGEILGQDTMDYVSAGSEAELKVTKALDIKVATGEEEVSRVRGAIKNPANYPLFDLVTIKGTIAITNNKSEAATVRLRHDYTGELLSADNDAVNKRTSKGLKDVNSRGRVTWNKAVGAGKTLTLGYTYQLYVNSTRGD